MWPLTWIKKKTKEKTPEKFERDILLQLRLHTFIVPPGQENAEVPDVQAIIQCTRNNEVVNTYQVVRQNGIWRFLATFTSLISSTGKDDGWGGEYRTQLMLENLDQAVLWELKHGHRKPMEYGSQVPEIED